MRQMISVKRDIKTNGYSMAGWFHKLCNPHNCILFTSQCIQEVFLGDQRCKAWNVSLATVRVSPVKWLFTSSVCTDGRPINHSMSLHWFSSLIIFLFYPSLPPFEKLSQCVAGSQTSDVLQSQYDWRCITWNGPSRRGYSRVWIYSLLLDRPPVNVPPSWLLNVSILWLGEEREYLKLLNSISVYIGLKLDPEETLTCIKISGMSCQQVAG